MLVELYESTLGILEGVAASPEAALDVRRTDTMMRRLLPEFTRAGDVLLRSGDWQHVEELLDRMRTPMFALATRCSIESTQYAARWIAGVAEQALESRQHGVYLAAGRVLSASAIEFARRCPDHGPRVLDFALRNMRLMDERLQELERTRATGATQQFLQEWRSSILQGRYWDVFRVPEAMCQEIRTTTYPSLAKALDAMAVMSQEVCGFARETIVRTRGVNTYLRWGLASGLFRLASAWVETGGLEQMQGRRVEVDRQLRMSLGLLHTMRVWPQPAGDAPDERSGEALLAHLIDATKDRYHETTAAAVMWHRIMVAGVVGRREPMFESVAVMLAGEMVLLACVAAAVHDADTEHAMRGAARGTLEKVRTTRRRWQADEWQSLVRLCGTFLDDYERQWPHAQRIRLAGTVTPEAVREYGAQFVAEVLANQ
jgi:hypothetical protein